MRLLTSDMSMAKCAVHLSPEPDKGLGDGVHGWHLLLIANACVLRAIDFT